MSKSEGAPSTFVRKMSFSICGKIVSKGAFQTKFPTRQGRKLEWKTLFDSQFVMPAHDRPLRLQMCYVYLRLRSLSPCSAPFTFESWNRSEFFSK